MGVQPALLGLVDLRLGTDAGRALDLARRVGDPDGGGADLGIGERDEARRVALDVHEHPLGMPGLAIQVDLTHATQPLPARIKDVAAGPFGIVPEKGFAGKLGHMK